jgi:hypothetical protein
MAIKQRYGKRLMEYVDITDNTPIQKLSALDQIRVLLKKMTHDDAAELQAENAVTRHSLELQADLSEILNKALDPLRRGQSSAVSVSLPSIYEKVLDDVFNNSRINQYYNTKISKPSVEYDGVPYNFRLDLEVKD